MAEMSDKNLLCHFHRRMQNGRRDLKWAELADIGDRLGDVEVVEVCTSGERRVSFGSPARARPTALTSKSKLDGVICFMVKGRSPENVRVTFHRQAGRLTAMFRRFKRLHNRTISAKFAVFPEEKRLISILDFVVNRKNSTSNKINAICRTADVDEGLACIGPAAITVNVIDFMSE